MLIIIIINRQGIIRMSATEGFINKEDSDRPCLTATHTINCRSGKYNPSSQLASSSGGRMKRRCAACDSSYIQKLSNILASYCTHLHGVGAEGPDWKNNLPNLQNTTKLGGIYVTVKSELICVDFPALHSRLLCTCYFIITRGNSQLFISINVIHNNRCLKLTGHVLSALSTVATLCVSETCDTRITEFLSVGRISLNKVLTLSVTADTLRMVSNNFSIHLTPS